MATDSWQWTDANGTVTSLSGTNSFVMWDEQRGPDGVWLPPVKHIEYIVPQQPGSQLRYSQIQPREVTLPLLVKGSDGTETTLVAVQRQLQQTFNPTLGTGKLTVTRPDGSTRILNCRYQDGFVGTATWQVAGAGWRLAVVTFHAFDPWWYDNTTQNLLYQTGQPVTFFPFFPLRLSGSTVFAQPTVTNPGDVVVYPIWTITGPLSAIILQNLTTGALLSLPGLTLGASDTLVIDTRIGVKTVTLNGSTNEYGALSSASTLWALAAGANSLSLQGNNATAASQIRLTFTAAYAGY